MDDDPEVETVKPLVRDEEKKTEGEDGDAASSDAELDELLDRESEPCPIILSNEHVN